MMDTRIGLPSAGEGRSGVGCGIGREKEGKLTGRVDQVGQGKRQISYGIGR